MLELKVLLISLTVLAIGSSIALVIGLITGKQQLCLDIAIKVKNGLKIFYQDVVKFPLYIISHPVQGYNEFKTEKKAKMYAAISILVAYVLTNILSYNYLGPVVNTNNPMKFNSITIIIYGVVPVVLIAVANWSITSLFDGKGKMKEIFMMICYSYFPLVVTNALMIVVSNFITSDEVMFLTIIEIVGYAGTAYMLFMGLVIIHEYGVFKTVISVLGTVVAILIILFLALLIFDLSQQVYGFFYSLYKEIMTRFMM